MDTIFLGTCTAINCLRRDIEYLIHPELVVATTGYKKPKDHVKGLMADKPENIDHVHVIGDDAETRGIHGAIHDSYRVAHEFAA